MHLGATLASGHYTAYVRASNEAVVSEYLRCSRRPPHPEPNSQNGPSSMGGSPSSAGSNNGSNKKSSKQNCDKASVNGNGGSKGKEVVILAPFCFALCTPNVLWSQSILQVLWSTSSVAPKLEVQVTQPCHHLHLARHGLKSTLFCLLTPNNICTIPSSNSDYFYWKGLINFHKRACFESV